MVVLEKGAVPLSKVSNRVKGLSREKEEGMKEEMLTHPCDRCPNSADDNDIISGANQQPSPSKGRYSRGNRLDSRRHDSPS